MSESGLNQHWNASLTTSGSNSVTFIPQQPVLVKRVTAVITTATTVTAPIVTVNHQRAGGAALSPTGAAEGGTMTIPIATAGLGAYKDMTVPIVVLPGEQLVLTVTTTSTAGVVQAGLVYEPLAFVDGPARSRQISTTPGSTAAPNYLSLMTRVTV